MRKGLLLIFTFFILSSITLAQDIRPGLKAGMNVANLGRSGFLARIGVHLGGTVEFVTTPYFSIQTELTYSLQGAAIDRSQNIYLNYHYFNIPLLAKAYFYEDASFELGMQYGFLMSAVNKSDIYTDKITDQVNRNDVAAVFGLNYMFEEKYSIGIRYLLGITNTQYQDIIYEKRLTNRVLQISAGIVF